MTEPTTPQAKDTKKHTIHTMIRRIKLSYMLYNLFQRKKLQHNVALYRKLGLRKAYFSPVSSRDFAHLDPAALSLKDGLPSATQTALYARLDEPSKQSIRDFGQEGYAIIHQYLDEAAVAAVNKEIEDLMASGQVSFKYGNKIMFAIKQSALLRGIGEDAELRALLSALMGDEASLFQSINFLTGSQQKTHSDSIHMTTFPLGGLLGVWIALEDIGLDNGPLHYYPQSHKLPYYLNADYDNEGNWLMLGDKGYGGYEQMLAEKVAAHGIQKKVFTAKKGDLLIWHANLLHGGEPHLDKARTRKSMVLHYFGARHICYHEITQRPALMG